MTYRRGLTLLGVAGAAFVALLAGEILLALNRTYLVDVDFAIDRTVDPTQADAVPIELRVLGDSTVAGVGAPDHDGALPTQLATRVAERTGRPVHVVGLGMSGARTADVRRHQLERVGPADVLVIVIGSNDVTHGLPPWRMTADTSALLRDARALGMPVVLGGIPRFANLGALAPPLREVTDAYAAVLRERQRAAAERIPDVAFVDIAALASPRFLGRPESMSRDQFHPSPVGYGFWADALTPAVVAALEQH